MSATLTKRLGAPMLAVALMIAACAPGPTLSPSPAADLPRGGTLHLGIPADDPPPSALASSIPGFNLNALDPQIGGWYDANELQRCCLSRTLVSYEGARTAEGGTVLRPDLAEALPEVSADGLTWTFRIRHGIRYAPPLADVEVTAYDFARGLLRALRFQQAAGFSVLSQLQIRGVHDYLDGVSDTVSGIVASDDHTLSLQLERPAGDLPSRLALTDTAPIPPSPADPSAPFGIATGHDTDYGRYAASTGPYMVDGAEHIDYGLPATDQQPASGYVPGRSLTLVRNPSWRPESDPLRPAHVDRIEITIGGTLEELSALVDDGQLDFVYSAGAPPQAPLDQVARFDADRNLGRVHRDSRDITRYLEMNLALPPFDDVHVRRAVNLVIDKARLIAEGEGVPAGHMLLDSIEQDLLRGHAPLGDPEGRADLAAARAEMAMSRYDIDGDGLCDAPECSNVSMLTFFRFREDQAASVAEDLSGIGISVLITPIPPPEGVDPWFDPAQRHGLYAGGPWAKDTLDAAPFFRTIFDSRWSMSTTNTNGNMVGASAERLASWGYSSAQVPPSVDDRIDACSVLTSATNQLRCWADLDLYMMEAVVPWVPLFYESYIRTTGPRVIEYSFDQQTAMPALDRVALAPQP